MPKPYTRKTKDSCTIERFNGWCWHSLYFLDDKRQALKVIKNLRAVPMSYFAYRLTVKRVPLEG